MILELTPQAHQAVTMLLGTILGLAFFGFGVETFDAWVKWKSARLRR